jgi:hypothetical protein
MIPEHYSRDVAKRCRSLIRNLMPLIANGLPDDGQFGGPLFTTFLLAMATPMVLLPIERIFKPGSGREGAADDRVLDPALAVRVADILAPEKSFGTAPFAGASGWAYVHSYAPFNAADTWPRTLLTALADPQAAKDAKAADAGRILLDLRNALAHGGITYLDKEGQNTEGPAAMLAFAGTKMDRGKVVGLNVLRVSSRLEREIILLRASFAPVLSAAQGPSPG